MLAERSTCRRCLAWLTRACSVNLQFHDTLSLLREQREAQRRPRGRYARTRNAMPVGAGVRDSLLGAPLQVA